MQMCDGKADCQDWLDEEECEAFITFQGYKKYFVPKPILIITTLVMNISISIDETGGLLGIVLGYLYLYRCSQSY